MLISVHNLLSASGSVQCFFETVEQSLVCSVRAGCTSNSADGTGTWTSGVPTIHSSIIARSSREQTALQVEPKLNTARIRSCCWILELIGATPLLSVARVGLPCCAHARVESERSSVEPVATFLLASKPRAANISQQGARLR